MQQPETTPTTELRPFKQHLYDAWQLYTRHFWQYIGMMAVTFLAITPLVIVLLAFIAAAAFFSGSGNDAMAAANITNIILGFIGILAMIGVIYLVPLTQIGILVQIKELAANNVRSVFSYLKEANQYFLSFIGMGILSVLMVLAGFIALVIPGLIIVTFLTFSPWVVVYEHASATGAIKRSFSLVKNNFLRVISRWYAPLIVLQIIISMPNAFLREGSPEFFLLQLLTMIASFALAPFINIYLYILYRDLLHASAPTPPTPPVNTTT